MQRQAGEIFEGRYEIEGYLGGGGMGVVYKATEIGTGKIVVIKCIRPELIRSGASDAQQFIERFAIEADAMRRITHPGVVKLLDYQLSDTGTPYLVTELINGHHLAYPEIDLQAPMPVLWGSWMPFLNAVDQLLEILAGVHASGVIHRDLKPENIMLQPSFGGAWLVRVLDFGLAKIHATGSASSPMGNLTQQGAGTMLYMAPEQFMAPDQISARTDHYAVGLMLYRALCGKHAFDATEDNSLGSLLSRSQHSVSMLGPPIPKALAKVVARTTRKDTHERFPNTRAFRQALQGAIQSIAAQLHLPLPVQLHAAPQAQISDPSTQGGVAHAETQAASGLQPSLQRQTGPAFLQEPSPHLDEALVILPDGPLYDELWLQLLYPTLAAIELPELDRYLQPRRISPAELTLDTLNAERYEKLEYARLVLWEITAQQPAVERFLLFWHRAGLVSPIRTLRAEPPPELVHLPATRYDAAPQHQQASQQALGELARGLLNRRWLTHAQTHQWQSHEDSTPMLLNAAYQTMRGSTEGVLHILEVLLDQLDNPALLFRHALAATSTAKDIDDWSAIAQSLESVVAAIPEYGPAWRELGVASGKIGQRARALQCLDKATQLTPWDHDAWSSYGGVLKKQAAQLAREAQRCEDEALSCYQNGVSVSGGHPYPLLNALRLEMLRSGRLELDDEKRNYLLHAIHTRSHQAHHGLDTPWCHFDLAEARLYLGQPEQAISALSAGGDIATWALETFLSSLLGLRAAEIAIAGLDNVIAWVEDQLN